MRTDYLDFTCCLLLNAFTILLLAGANRNLFLLWGDAEHTAYEKFEAFFFVFVITDVKFRVQGGDQPKQN